MSTRITMRRSLLILGIALLIVLLATVLTATVAAKHTTQPRTWQAVVGIQSQDQAMQGMAFLPGTLWVNVGDTVVWTARAGEIHTVTFLKPGQQRLPFNQNDPLQALPQGGHVYDGTSYYNSGLMSNMSSMPGMPGDQTYSLTFGVAGDFTYYCLVHPTMIGMIHVRPAGTPYPYSQADYDHQIKQATTAMLLDGQKLAEQARDESTNQHVTLGIGDDMVSVMRFFPQHIVIHLGQTITFTNGDVMTPHTVTFEPTSSKGNFAPYGNPKTFDGSAPLNSGFLGSDPHWFGTSYSVRFVKAGTYAFRCDLHDDMGMLATIMVLPR
jgi:plastocyanin